MQPMQQHWKFKPSQPADFNLPTNFRRKRRHSEPGLTVTRTYKSYVTHWKLDAKRNGSGPPQPLVSSTTMPSVSAAASMALQGLTPEQVEALSRQPPSPGMGYSPSVAAADRAYSPFSGSSNGSSVHSAPSSPESSYKQQFNMFQYNRDPGTTRRSPSPSHTSPSPGPSPARHGPMGRRTSLPNINDPYFLPKRDYEQGKLDSIPEFSLPFPPLNSFSTFKSIASPSFSSTHQVQQADLPPFLFSKGRLSSQEDSSLLPSVQSLLNQIKLVDEEDGREEEVRDTHMPLRKSTSDQMDSVSSISAPMSAHDGAIMYSNTPTHTAPTDALPSTSNQSNYTKMSISNLVG